MRKIEVIEINTEFIKLDQFLKWTGIAGSGVEAKIIISEGIVKVNGEVELQRGKKLYDGFTVEVENNHYKVKRGII